ncbi:hypothetical protein KVT40_004792 [Elsinoe batatas]|uniref:Dyp-type peroxidase n=1 Tax=Elsinoe batatas TaxID=2601811 RepID=A0A8K0L2L7_9PEZI|nr:hypothetical protein KVT40_004792 [Elsinoe batatas]
MASVIPEMIQGDIFPGLPKKTETFLFFKINGDLNKFKSDLASFLPLITTGAQVLEDRDRIAQHKRSGAGGLLKLSGVNISFSIQGLGKLGLNGSENKINDQVFEDGMLSDAQALGDKGTTVDGKYTPAWDSGFVSQDIDGVILVTGDCQTTVDEATNNVKQVFGAGQPNASITEAFSIVGVVRPDAEQGHEHFGFEDGVSLPSIDGLDTAPNKGQVPIPQGVVLCDRTGDNDDNKQAIPRPDWAKDGSFLCFRKLAQLVLEFDAFLENNKIQGVDNGKELLGARLVGRWKSGAPVILAPLKDDPELAQDSARNNDFDFSQDAGQVCPFAAHIRKTNPRTDFISAGLDDTTVLTNHLFPRRGIPYGPEVTPEETSTHRTTEDRGLLFVCYQSNLSHGFQFVQKSWANNQGFIFGKNPNPGFDPIIGQNADDTDRTMTGAGLNDVAGNLNLGPFEWVVSKGGAYFFSPSIRALKENFAAVAA